MEKKRIIKSGVTSPAHVLKLLDRIGIECKSGFFDVNTRKVMRDKLSQIVPLFDEMEKKDEDYQNLPQIRIPALKKELKVNDEVLKKNHENTNQQIQIGLYQKGFPQTSPMYDSLLEKMKLDLEDAQIKLDSGLKLMNPTFEFQTNPRWVEIQKEYHKQNIKAIGNNVKEILKQVEEVKKGITTQNERIKARRIQIIDELKDLKEDVSEFADKTPNYIG